MSFPTCTQDLKIFAPYTTEHQAVLWSKTSSNLTRCQSACGALAKGRAEALMPASSTEFKTCGQCVTAQPDGLDEAYGCQFCNSVLAPVAHHFNRIPSLSELQNYLDHPTQQIGTDWNNSSKCVRGEAVSRFCFSNTRLPYEIDVHPVSSAKKSPLAIILTIVGAVFGVVLAWFIYRWYKSKLEHKSVEPVPWSNFRPEDHDHLNEELRETQGPRGEPRPQVTEFTGDYNTSSHVQQEAEDPRVIPRPEHLHVSIHDDNLLSEPRSAPGPLPTALPGRPRAQSIPYGLRMTSSAAQDDAADRMQSEGRLLRMQHEVWPRRMQTHETFVDLQGSPQGIRVPQSGFPDASPFILETPSPLPEDLQMFTNIPMPSE